MKKIIINTFITFILCFLAHNIYPIISNKITAIFFPVNESIWEHMKMLYTCILLGGFINYLIFKTNNNFTSSFLTGIFSIIFYLVCFLPFNSKSKILIFGLLFLDILLSEILRKYIINKKILLKYNHFFIIAIIISYIIFGYLTYRPIINNLFKDSINNKYGINTYEI